MNNENAYDKDELEAIAIAAIDEHGLVFFTEVCAYLPCSTSTAYNYELEKLETIKNALTAQKVSRKVAMRKNWLQSTQPALQLGLYKLLATPEELAALSMQHIDHSTKGESINQEKRITFSDGSVRDEYGNIISLPTSLQPPD